MTHHLETNAASRIGCHCWGDQDASIAGQPYSAQCGCRWVRATRPMQMDTVLRAPGQYDFGGRGNRAVDLALENGLSVMGILDARWGNETGLNVLGFCSPVWEHLDAWADFARQAVGFFKDRVKYWEIINEPPFFWWYPTPPGVRMPEKNPDTRRAPIRRYAELLKASARAIREADPEARIVVGSGFPDGAFLRTLYELGAKDDFDVASVHYLGCKHPDDFARGMRTLRRVMAQYGDARKPLWDTENGPMGAVIGQAVQTPAEYEGLTNLYRHCFAHEYGLERYFWFNHEPARPGPDGALQPAYRALAALHRHVGEGPLRLARHLEGEVHLYVFEGPAGPVSLLWATAPATARLPGRRTEAADWLGQPVRLGGDVELSGRPLFLPGDLGPSLDARVTGRRLTVATPMKQPGPDVKERASPRVPGLAWEREAAWAAVPGREAVPAVKAADHFCRVMTSVPAELQFAHDDDALYLRVRTWDDRLDAAAPTGLVQFSVRDSDPGVAEWGYFTSGWGLFSLYLSKRQRPLVLRYEHLQPDRYPAGVVAAAGLVAERADGGLVFRARIPWGELGPCRPGRHNPFQLLMVFCRADGMLDVPADDEPWEWSHNYADNFIVTPPAFAARATFA
jgi:hypothetical protein